MITYNILCGLCILFFIYVFVYAVLFFTLTFFASIRLDDYESRRNYMSYAKLGSEKNYVPISIILPVHNEAFTVIDSINSLIHLDYPVYEIVIVNDGSTDKTGKVVLNHFEMTKVFRPVRKSIESMDADSIYEAFEDGKRILLVNKKQSNRSDALNLGINVCNYPFYICMDAGSLLQDDALKKITEPFLEDDTTIAVSGNIRVSNTSSVKRKGITQIYKSKKPLVLFQTIEYLRVFLTSRTSFNGINANFITSGSFGLYSKQAAIKAGGYTHDAIGEDMDMLIKMHGIYSKNKITHKIAYAADAICWTQVPENTKKLAKQREKWHRGMGQSLRFRRSMFLNPIYGSAGIFTYPYFVIFEYLAPVLEILGLAAVLVAYILGVVNMYFLLAYLLLYMGFNILISIVAVLLERYLFKRISTSSMRHLMLYCILELFGYRQMCSIFCIVATFTSDKSLNRATV